MLGLGGDVLSVVGRAVIMPPKRSETQFAVSNTEADLPRGVSAAAACTGAGRRWRWLVVAGKGYILEAIYRDVNSD